MSSAKKLRLQRAMSMKATGPSLTPIVRINPYLDYMELDCPDKKKYLKTARDIYETAILKCKTNKDYFKCMASFREQRRLLALKGDYDGAARIDGYIRKLSDFFLENHMYTSKAELCAVSETIFSTQRDTVSTIQDRWDNKIDTMKTTYQRELADLEAENARKLAKFDNSHPQKLPIRYNKLSPELLNLREIEKHLIASRRFEEAKKIHQEFERKKREELNKQKRQYFDDSEKRRTEIIKLGEKKVNALKDAWERRISEAKITKEHEVTPHQKSYTSLERNVTRRKSEYIGQEDPIPEEVVFVARKVDPVELENSVNVYKSRDLVSFDKSITPRSVSHLAKHPGPNLVGAERPVEYGVVDATNKSKTVCLRKQARDLDSRRWPRN